MFTIAGFSRRAGMLGLILAGILPALPSASAEEACDAAWHMTAEQRAAEGLDLAEGYNAEQRVKFWRLVVLGDEEPRRLMEPYYGYPPHLILPDAFPNDPDVARIADLIHVHQLAEAVTAIEALTRIPDPSRSDIATERLLVRSELQFAGVLWADGWEGYDGVSSVGARAQKWMALLNAHFMSLPRSILDHDIVVNGAYWRAVDDLRWFLRSDRSREWQDNQQADDWWLLGAASSLPVLEGVALATRESEFLDWLQSMEALNDLGRSAWIAYLDERFKRPGYENAFSHVVAMQDSKSAGSNPALAWQVAVSLWWAPGVGELGQFSQTEGFLQGTVADLEQRAATCALSTGEQYALGPLRHNALRQRAILYQEGWSAYAEERRIKPEEAATVDDATRREVMRFALAVNQPELARPFSAAITPRGEDALFVPALRALAATDLDQFAAANPDPSALNLLPVRLLADLIERPGLRPDLRAAVARMAWVRAFVLDNDGELKRLTPLLSSTNPQMKPLVDAYEASWSKTGRRRAGLVLLLKAPGMQMVLWGDWAVPRVRLWSEKEEDWRDAQFKTDHQDPNDNNWWCRFDLYQRTDQMRQAFYNAPLGLESDHVRLPWGYPSGDLARYREQALRNHPILKQIDWEELGALTKIANAPTFLTEAAVEWAESSWWDRTFHADEIAEALELSVQVTRWGCHREGSNKRASYRAFRVLHERFPDSAAAKNTRYWYD